MTSPRLIPGANVPQVTGESLDALPQALGGGLGNRGVRESITEARRQLGWGNDLWAARWASRAELLAGVITQAEYNARCDAIQAARDAERGLS
jgi:hypothetical protein